VAFRWLIGLCTETFFQGPTGITTEGISDAGPSWWLILLIPTLGGLLVGGLVQRLAPEASGHGTDSVIHAYHRLKGEVRQRVIYVKALASALTIGTGGSAGQEGPVAQVGAGIGSSIARALKLPVRDRRLLLLSGGSAGIGAMFRKRSTIDKPRYLLIFVTATLLDENGSFVTYEQPGDERPTPVNLPKSLPAPGPTAFPMPPAPAPATPPEG
jgi:hypothetical protein